MDTGDFLSDVGGWLKAVFSKTLIPFHGVLVAAIFVVMNVLQGWERWQGECSLVSTMRTSSADAAVKDRRLQGDREPDNRHHVSHREN
jgi:hypothetical protein